MQNCGKPCGNCGKPAFIHNYQQFFAKFGDNMGSAACGNLWKSEIFAYFGSIYNSEKISVTVGEREYFAKIEKSGKAIYDIFF